MADLAGGCWLTLIEYMGICSGSLWGDLGMPVLAYWFWKLTKLR